MTHEGADDVAGTSVHGLLLIVVGASIEAEVTDRPLAYRLQGEIAAAPVGDGAVGGEMNDRGRLTPVVCTDLWYLNTQPLRLRPTIAIGSPESNAATAFLATRMPTALVVEERYRIQLDPEYMEMKACLWGTSDRDTAAAVDVFVDRYLAEFLRNARGL